MHILKISAIFLVTTMLNPCYSNDIEYDLYDVEKIKSKSTENITLSIEKFEEDWDSCGMDGAQYNLPRYSDSICYNSVYDYYEDTVGIQIAEVLTSHLEKTDLFDDVLYQENLQADFYLRGTLSCFYSKVTLNEKAYVAYNDQDALLRNQYASPMLSMVASGIIQNKLDKSGETSQFEFRIEYSNLVIHNKAGAFIAILDDIVTTDKVETRPAGNYWSAGSFLNGRLKEHNQKLIEALKTLFETKINP